MTAAIKQNIVDFVKKQSLIETKSAQLRAQLDTLQANFQQTQGALEALTKVLSEMEGMSIEEIVKDDDDFKQAIDKAVETGKQLNKGKVDLPSKEVADKPLSDAPAGVKTHSGNRAAPEVAEPPARRQPPKIVVTDEPPRIDDEDDDD